MAKRTLNPFAAVFAPDIKSLGGAHPKVEAAAQRLASSPAPMLAARIYAAPSLVNTEDSDPRYNEGKSNAVENIYFPAAADAAPPRSGFAQLMNWLTTGRMK
jgi:hypothetical protein